LHFSDHGVLNVLVLLEKADNRSSLDISKAGWNIDSLVDLAFELVVFDQSVDGSFNHLLAAVQIKGEHTHRNWLGKGSDEATDFAHLPVSKHLCLEDITIKLRAFRKHMHPIQNSFL
jgi:hypothetical protein